MPVAHTPCGLCAVLRAGGVVVGGVGLTFVAVSQCSERLRIRLCLRPFLGKRGGIGLYAVGFAGR